MTECRGVNLDLRSFICQPTCVGGVKLSPLKHEDAFSAPVMQSKEKQSRRAVGVTLRTSQAV
ncbi:hypothetical protein EYF80_008231 [Liparis tanakae]|uniref:Uncharacterized protein n=1 Tax=Liparis tanakae TaxID=230148 RepID=A0A4Z2ITW7_9TELE|nr:hypothetical protein EYF80_008231 [Liparis tanakae]